MIANLLKLLDLSLSTFHYHTERCGKTVYKVAISVQKKQKIAGLETRNLFFISIAFVCFFCFTNDLFSFGLGDVRKHIDKVKQTGAKIGKTAAKAFSDISEEEQYYIGRSVGANLLGKYKLSECGRLKEYVSAIGQTLATASERPDTFKGYHFIVLDEPEQVNAFSVPSGFIFISTGLIAKAENEDELAGALAHEVAHIVYHHPSESIKNVYQDQLKKDLIDLAGEKVSESQKSELISGLAKGLNKVSGMIVDSAAKGYSREKEEESDLMAAQIMVDAGYDPNALTSIIRKLQPIEKGGLGTHGNLEKRAEKVSDFIKKLERHPEITNIRKIRFDQVVRH